MKRHAILALLIGAMCLNSGCVLTKIVTVPMRAAGAIVSIIPVSGNTAHDAVDKAADIVDELPF